MAERYVKEFPQPVRDGFIVLPPPDGGFQFDTGVCGVALVEGYEALREARYLNAAKQAADCRAEDALRDGARASESAAVALSELLEQFGPNEKWDRALNAEINALRQTSLHVALRRPETMKRESVMKVGLCGKIEPDERWSEVVNYLSFNSRRSLTRVAQTCPKLSLRQAPEER